MFPFPVMLRFVECEEDLIRCGRVCRAWRDAVRTEQKRRRETRRLQWDTKRRGLQDDHAQWQRQRSGLSQLEQEHLDRELYQILVDGQLRHVIHLIDRGASNDIFEGKEREFHNITWYFVSRLARDDSSDCDVQLMAFHKWVLRGTFAKNRLLTDVFEKVSFGFRWNRHFSWSNGDPPSVF